jgi:predicted transcriptional regulator|tara:strand:- start:340 stop:546 length:207 start_codon:yes stop_codon:yes gene_type:complete
MEDTESTSKTQGRSPRRSLAVDDETFQALLDICEFRGWTKIEALKRLINEEKGQVAQESDQKRAYSRP